jgi:hypothetical protein
VEPPTEEVQPCEQCGKPARRLLSAPPIVFKGSGWYSTDSQRSLRTGVGTERGGGEPDGDAGSASDDSSNGTAEAAPAAKKASPRAKSTKAKAAAADD